jgi:hypothetical protein
MAPKGPLKDSSEPLSWMPIGRFFGKAGRMRRPLFNDLERVG